MSVSPQPGVHRGKSFVKGVVRSTTTTTRSGKETSRSPSPSRIINVLSGCHQLEIELRRSDSLAALRSALRRQLKMRNQSLDIFDAQGEHIRSDKDMCNAINRGDTPFSVAASAEASLMHIEQRREELSQVQWALVREQFSGLAEKLAKVGRSVDELGEFVSDQRREHGVAIKQLRQELKELLYLERDAARTNELKVSEHIDVLAQSLHGERSSREDWQQSLEQQIQSIRGEFEHERSCRNALGAGEVAVFDELRHASQNEGQARKAIEDRLHHDVMCLGERLDGLTEQHNEKVQDLTHDILQMSCKYKQDVQDLMQKMIEGKTNLEHWQHQVELRVSLVEAESSKMETRLKDSSNRHVASTNDLWKRLDTLSMIFEQARINERARALSSDRQPRLEESTGRIPCSNEKGCAVSSFSPASLAMKKIPSTTQSEASLAQGRHGVFRSPSAPVLSSSPYPKAHLISSPPANCSLSIAIGEETIGGAIELGNEVHAAQTVAAGVMRSPTRQQLRAAVGSPNSSNFKR